MSMPNVGRARLHFRYGGASPASRGDRQDSKHLGWGKRRAGPYGKTSREPIKHALRRKRSVWETLESEKLRS